GRPLALLLSLSLLLPFSFPPSPQGRPLALLLSFLLLLLLLLPFSFLPPPQGRPLALLSSIFLFSLSLSSFSLSSSVPSLFLSLLCKLRSVAPLRRHSLLFLLLLLILSLSFPPSLPSYPSFIRLA